MNVDQLSKLGGVIPAAPVKKTITWTRVGKGGKEVSDTFDVFVRRLAYADQERILKLSGIYDQFVRGEDDESLNDPSINAATIAVALRLGEDGQERLSYEQCCQLDPSLASQFIIAINEVNPTPSKKS